MTDAQLMTLALAVIIPLSMLLYRNSRITDTKETLWAEIHAEAAQLKGEMVSLRAEIMARFDRFEAKLAIHEVEHHHK